MDFLQLIKKYYKEDSLSFEILLKHSKAVKEKALSIAKKQKKFTPDMKFIEEAALLHDIGIFLTNAPKIGCFGKHPYIAHGFLGGEVLRKEGFPKHALVCERHVGVGITAKEIKEKNLPLPLRDMLPLTTEEEIISLADNFFSKSKKDLFEEEKISDIKKELETYGVRKALKFEEWIKKYEI